MKRGGEQRDARSTPLSYLRTPAARLILVPLFVYLAWGIEIFLFEGNVSLFLHPDPAGLFAYTLVACVLVGLIVPLLLIRRSFVTGDVNMHQLGFRPLRRTLLMVVLTVILMWAGVILQTSSGTDRTAFIAAFLLLLPSGIASVMVCWVLAGTHVQALVRNGGVLISVTTGIIVTGILFGLIPLFLFPAGEGTGLVFRFIPSGILAAVFFFAVRDVWAASVAVTGALVYLISGQFGMTSISPGSPAILAPAALSVISLAVIHWYLSRHYVTIPVPAP